MTQRPRTVSAVLLVMCLVLGACADNGSRRTVVVSAASSLTDAFTEMEAAFESVNEDVDVTLNFAGTSALREQVLEGAPVDVLATADVRSMNVVADAGLLAGAVSVFASNRLVIAVPVGNPAGVTGLGDFARGDLVTGLCAEGVPCGDLARVVLSAAGIEAVVDTNEPNVRALLAKVEAGELDAGITYATDVLSSNGTVDAVEIQSTPDAVATYTIAAITGASHLGEAEAFIAFVLSPDGAAILSANGFGGP